VDIMTENAQSGDLRQLFQKIIPGAIGQQIEKSVQSIFPMKDVFVHKIKMLKSPKFDLTKLMEVHTVSEADASAKVDRPEAALNPTAETGLVGSGGRL
jgi:small subunit ribosomal protein S3Ae